MSKFQGSKKRTGIFRGDQGSLGFQCLGSSRGVTQFCGFFSGAKQERISEDKETNLNIPRFLQQNMSSINPPPPLPPLAPLPLLFLGFFLKSPLLIPDQPQKTNLSSLLLYRSSLTLRCNRARPKIFEGIAVQNADMVQSNSI